MSLTDGEMMSALAMTSATREAELLRIIEQKDAEICKLRHALNSLEQKHGILLKKKGVKKDD